MAASGNFATIGGLEKSSNFTFSQGMLKYSTTTNQRGFIGSTAFPNTGKWYFECRVLGVGGTQDDVYIGVCTPNTMRGNLTSTRGGATGTYGGYVLNNYAGAAYLNGSKQTDDGIGNFRSFPQNVGIAIDRDNNNFKWTYDGSSYSSTYSIPADVDLYLYLGSGGGTQTASGVFNFGQDSTFGGLVSAGGNAVGNGFGDFIFAVPSNYLSLCSANLPINSNIDPAETDDDIPTKQFNVVTWTGNRSSNSTINNITGVGFQPDFVWLKILNNTYDHRLVDSSRGVTEAIRSNKTTVEQTEANGLYQFDSDGFSVKGDNNYNSNGDPFVGYCWRANGGTTATNTSGTTTSTVQANQAAGFSIVQYNGSLTSTGVVTIGHGLSSAPELIIKKQVNKTGRWYVWHTGSSGANYMLELNTSSAQQDKSGNGNMSLPTSTVFYTNYTEGSNENGYNNVAYCWHGVEGYSKFGSFEGNSDNDGPFIYTGFKPRLLFIKNIDSTSAWGVYDGERPGFNDCDLGAWDETTGYNNNIGTYPCDILSSGFKLRTSNSTVNSSHTWVYGAWGDVPFKYNNTHP